MAEIRTINDINEGAALYYAAKDALLIDVRQQDEYAEGHLPGSVNIPLLKIRDIDDIAPSYDTEIFVYCLSGGRSWQAAAVLEQMGYENIVNIGGIEGYKGKVEI